MIITWNDISIIAYLLGAAFVATVYFEWRRRGRLQFIGNYRWPPGLVSKLASHHRGLTAKDLDQVQQGLRQFFRAYVNGGYRPVAMPSQIVDDLWHEFILYTRDYDRFCRQAFGRKLHHTPAAALSRNQKSSNEGLRRVWWQCCKEERIDPMAPTTLPLLFALDATLSIPGGYRYHPNCEALREQGVAGTQCGGDFSSTSFDGGTDGLGDGDGGSGGDGDGGGGGCGGD